MSDFYTSMNSPVGPLTLFEDQGSLTALEWGRAPAARATPLLTEATRQLTAYFDGGLREFDLPLAPIGGTDFQRRVWQAMRDIPMAGPKPTAISRRGSVVSPVRSAAPAAPIPCRS